MLLAPILFLLLAGAAYPAEAVRANPAAPGSGGTACEATDQRGVARPVGAACDIGAFEFSVPAAVVLVSLRATATPPWAAVVPVMALILGAAAVLAWCMGLSGAIDQADRWLWE